MRQSLFLFVIWLSCALTLDTNADVSSHDKVVVCYIGSWAAYRPGNGAYTWNNIDSSLCTHIVYSFAGLEVDNFMMKSIDPHLDFEDSGGKGQYKKLMSLKNRHPGLKITIAIGGWNEGSGKYSTMASSEESRNKFIEHAVSFVRKNGFDGLDMDWEYPANREGSKPTDKENFVLLLKGLREELSKYGLILTAAVGASPRTIQSAYDVPSISQYLDLIHIMCYDYHGSWDARTGHNAPLKLAEGAKLSEDHRLSLEDTVKLYIKLGAPRSKLVLGIPFYGRTFLLPDPNVHHVGAAAEAKGFQGPYTREDGFLGYNEICLELKENGTRWTQEWDDTAKVPYMYSDKRWVGYDDHRSITIKAMFAYKEGLAGAMVWSIDTDDFLGDCSEVRYPLLKSINSAFKLSKEQGSEVVTTQQPTGGNSGVILTGSLSCILLVVLMAILH